MAQIKNYYYDHKKQFGKNGGAGDTAGDGDVARSSAPGSTDGESDIAERAEMYLAAAGAAQFPMEGMRALGADLSEQQRAGLSAQSLQSAADVWARAQIQQQQEHQLQQQQQQHEQEQQLQQQLSSQEARRLLHSHQHQQVMSNISSMFPWVTAAQVAQAQAHVQVQAAAFQQQQQQQQQHQDSAGLDWSDRKLINWMRDCNLSAESHQFLLRLSTAATQMQNLFAMRHAGHHHGFSVDSTSHLRTMALAGLAAMNQQTLAGNGMQMDTSYHSNEAERGVNYGGSNEGHSMRMGGSAAAPSSSSSNAALALGMLATQSVNNGNAYSPEENQSNYEQNDRSDHYQSG